MQPSSVRFFKWLGIIAIVLIGLGSTFTIVSSQERAVVTRLGAIDRVLEEGLHFKLPFIETVYKMDVQIQAYPVSELAYSKDAQTITAEVTLNYHVDAASVAQLFREVKRDYKDRLITPAIKEGIKAVLANYTAQGLIDNRAKLPIEIRAVMAEDLAARGIIVDNVTITNFDFDDAYESAVREKQVAEQNALKQVNVTKQEEEKKKQDILKAEALSEKTRLEVQALQSSQGKQIIEKIYAEAALEAAKKWNGVLPTQMIPGGSVPFINLK